MKFYESSFNYDYTFPAVALAYFLRYPNPYSRHVLSSDVIDRYIDPETNRLHTVRLHLKKSKVPSAILKFLPRSIAGPGGTSQSYVLEKSTIDVKEGWMETESKNMEWTGILSVVEKQTYRRQRLSEIPGDDLQTPRPRETTTCKTVVTFVSHLGQGKFLSRRKPEQTADGEEEPPKQGLFAAWSTAGIQRTIELVGVKRTKTALVNGKEGMNVVLERLRRGGLVAVLEGMRRDRLEIMGAEGA
jgi:4-amino-4-deoxychorismate lyase